MVKKILKVRVESGIKLPVYKAIKELVPWSKIKVGQSFLVDEDIFGHQPIQRLRVYLRDHHMTTKQRFTVRKLRGDNTYRCWRIS